MAFNYLKIIGFDKHIDAFVATRKAKNVRDKKLLDQLIKSQQMEEADKVIVGTKQSEVIKEGDGIDPASYGDIDVFVDGIQGTDFIQTAQGDDVIYAYDGSTVLSGGGDDLIYGYGNCLIDSSDGNDTIYLAKDSDYLEFWSKGFNAKGSVVYARDGDDIIVGGSGSTMAAGGSGSDYLELGDGNDICFGGSDADTFAINLQDDGTDLIVDFYDIGDKIIIKNGSQFAGEEDWYLQESGYQGPNTPTSMADVFDPGGFSALDLPTDAPPPITFLNIVNKSNDHVAAQIMVGFGPNAVKTGGDASLNTGYFGQELSCSSSSIDLVGYVDLSEQQYGFA